MATRIRLIRPQLDDLATIREIEPERLRRVVEVLDSQEPPPLTPEQLERSLREVFVEDRETVEALLRQLLSLTSLQRQRHLDTDSVLEGIAYGIRSDDRAGWRSTELDRWQIIEPELRRLLDHPRVSVVSKALDLSYDYANLLQQARIVTDVRPVFDESAKRVEASVVSFTLRLRFDNTAGGHDLSLAMNEEDVRTLGKECERALNKSTAAARFMQQAGAPTYISGSGSESDASTAT